MSCFTNVSAQISRLTCCSGTGWLVLPALLLALGASRAEAAADDVLTQHNDTE